MTQVRSAKYREPPKIEPLPTKISANFPLEASPLRASSYSAVLETNMEKFNQIVTKIFNHDFNNTEGAGAAGGVGFAFIAFMNAKLSLGIDVLLKSYHFDELATQYDLVITGEGKLDEQSLNGKVISGIMSYQPKQLEFVVGSCTLDNLEYKVHAIVPDAATLDEALSKPKESLTKLIKKDFS